MLAEIEQVCTKRGFRYARRDPECHYGSGVPAAMPPAASDVSIAIYDRPMRDRGVLKQHLAFLGRTCRCFLAVLGS